MTITDTMINTGLAMIGQVRYSMSYPARLGPAFRDCSSFVLACAISAGGVPSAYQEGNTETLYSLNGSYLQEVMSYDDVQKGDIFILGQQGQSMGANGHTGFFISKGEVLHCSYSANGVTRTPARYVLDCKRSPSERYFRLKFAKTVSYKLIKNEDYTCTITSYISSHERPSFSSKFYKHLKPGDRYHYTKVYEANGYRWLYFKNWRGQEMYLPYRHVSDTTSLVDFN